MVNYKSYFVYLLVSKRNGTFYVGFTSNLYRRITEHKQEKYCGFTKRYNVKRLVYYEVFDNPGTAIDREKILKKLHRKKKIELIEKTNPTWRDLYYDLERYY